jgi:predicted P-loop ATPase
MGGLGMTDNVREFPRRPRRNAPEWHASLLVTDKGTFRANLANCLVALRHCPEWEGRIAFDKFAGRTMLVNSAPWELPQPLGEYQPREWCNVDTLHLTEWLQVQGINVGPPVADNAVETVGHENAFDPVADYLLGLEWDGVSRLGRWLTTYLHVEPTVYSAGVGMRWMISAVARIAEPGAKADHVLILEGKQGPGKSTALEILGGEWFTDQLSSLDSKDSSVDLQGAWIVELGELDAIAKPDIPRVKQYLSRRVDRYRPPYGRRVESFPRRCVFAGTHNPSGPWGRDATGARRLWPVTVGDIELDALRRDRDQLWAEAVHWYRAGFQWWITNAQEIEAAEAEQFARQDLDPWHQSIEEWLDEPFSRRDRVTVGELLFNVCGLELKHRGQREQNRVAAVLTTLGWKRQQYRVKGENGTEKRVWGYVRPESGDRNNSTESTVGPENPVTTMPLSPLPETESGDRNSPLESTLSPVSPVSPVENRTSERRETPSSIGDGVSGDTGDTVVFKGKIRVFGASPQSGDKESGDRLKGPGLNAEDLPENDPC